TSLYAHHQETSFLSKHAAQTLGKPYRLGADTEVGAPNAAVTLQVLRNPRGSLDQNCAANATPEVPAVDPDHPTVGVKQRAPGKARQELRGGPGQTFRLAATPAAK